jgi:hypothetical protein
MQQLTEVRPDIANPEKNRRGIADYSQAYS